MSLLDVHSLSPFSCLSLALLYIYFPRLVFGHDPPFKFHECRSMLRIVGFTTAKCGARLASPPRARLSAHNLRVDWCGRRTLRGGLLSATRGVTPTRRSHCAILAEARVRETRTLMSRVQAHQPSRRTSVACLVRQLRTQGKSFLHRETCSHDVFRLFLALGSCDERCYSAIARFK